MAEAAVILWWGAEIRVLTGAGELSRRRLQPSEDPVSAILELTGAARAGERGARIIYHPGTLEAHEVSCPKVSRPRLRRLLAPEFPALAAPDPVWSAEPIRRAPGGYATVLYLDPAARLRLLHQGLAAQGLPAEGAWPLQSLVEATPPCDAADGGFIAVVAIGSRALVSCVGPSGDRSLRFFEGGDAAAAAAGEAATMLARFDEGANPPGLAVAEEAATSPALSLAAFLGRARLLQPGSFSDFLNRKPLFGRLPPARQAMALAGITLAAGSAVFAWHAWQERERAQRQGAAWGELRQHLRQWVADRAAAQGRLEQLERALRQAEGPPQPHSAFLAALDKAVPDSIALQSLTIADGRFALSGRLAGGGPEDIARLRRDLVAAGGPWTLDPPPLAEGAAFVLTGSLRP